MAGDGGVRVWVLLLRANEKYMVLDMACAHLQELIQNSVQDIRPRLTKF